MQIVSLVIYLTAATSVTATTFADVFNDLRKTSGDLDTLATATNGFYGTSAQALALRNAYNTVLADWNQVTTDADNAVPPSVNDATQVYNYIISNLHDKSSYQLSACVNKKSIFQSSGILPQVCYFGRNLQTDISLAHSALIRKYPTQDLKNKGTASQSNFYLMYDNALMALGCPPAS